MSTSPQSPARTLVIIPVYNEVPTVERVLRAARASAPGADILAVDDGSTDGSGSRLEHLRDGIPVLDVLHHSENLGYGRSLIDGFAYAAEYGYDVAVTMDCDEQHEPALIEDFAARTREADIVSGSRYLRPDLREGAPPPDRWQINRLITERINELTGYGLTDAFCGFKAYRVAALRGLELTEAGYGFPLQFWLRARAHGLTVIERPVPLIYKANFERRFGGGLDDAERRLAYYLEIIDREVARCSTC